MAKRSLYKDIAGREWQQDGLRQMLAAYETGRDFLEAAAPGTGKTRFGIAAGRALLDRGMADTLVVVVPKADIRAEWVSEFADKASLEAVSVEDGADLLRNRDAACYVLTYAMLVNLASDVAQLCEEREVAIIADEIHHAGDDRAWGSALELATSNAAYRLGLTGTPFRSDASRIPILQYDAEIGAPHHEYHYGQALSDRVVAPVVFEWLGGSVTVTDPAFNDGTTETLVFGKSYDERYQNARLRYAMHPDAGFAYDIVRLAHKRLLGEREKGNAGGLVIAKDIEQARRLRDFIESELGASAMLVTCLDGEPEHVAEFRDGTAEWLVSVQMVSEGTNIPRLRVLAYTSTYTTQLYVIQAVGRLTRLEETREDGTVERPFDQLGYVVMPSDDRLQSFAASIEERIQHVLAQFPEKDTAAFREVAALPEYEAHNVFSILTRAVYEGTTLSGVRMSADALAEVAEQQAEKVRRLRAFGLVELADSIETLSPARYLAVTSSIEEAA